MFNTSKSNKIYRAFKVRLYPNKTEQRYLDSCINASRFIYNFFLDLSIEKNRAWRKGQGLPPRKPRLAKLLQSESQARNYKAIDELLKLSDAKWFNGKALTALKKMPDSEWLKETPNQCLQNSILSLESAFKHMKKTQAGFPRFKSKHDSIQSCSFSQIPARPVSSTNLRLPKAGRSSKPLWIKSRGIRQDFLDKSNKVTRITVTRDGNLYFASLLCEFDEGAFDEKLFVPAVHKAVGIDVGVAKPLTVSTDEGHAFVLGMNVKRDLHLLEQKRKRYERQMARQVKRSKNWHKTKTSIQACHRRERNKRSDFAEQVSSALAQDCNLVAFEDIKLQNMTRAVKRHEDGTPRKGVRAKSGLNREMLRLGLGFVRQRTEQKCKEYGRTFVLVDARYTSQECSACGCTSKLNRKSQAVFECVECGHSVCADANAAFNVVRRALAA